MGQNGSGKTTIIECLKYGTTGDLPPNSKGGAFIHDPKLCRETTVRAQVKLQFKPTTEAETDGKMVATRSLELNVKRSQRSQKTLEGNLFLLRRGERLTVSKTVAELNDSIPKYLGAPAAILENVVFCHQDEALWPLAEPSALKKKFDEIFEAQKYTKAVDNIKKIRKGHLGQMGELRSNEEHARQNKAKADRAEKKSRELHQEIEELREQVKARHEQAESARNKAQEAWNKAAGYKDAVESLKVAQRNQEWLQNQLEGLKASLKERPDPDDVLKAELSQFEERAKTHQTRVKQQTERYHDLEEEVKGVRARQSEKGKDLGKHEQQKVNHEQRLQEREQAIKESAREHGIRGYDTDLDDMQINEFMERITSLSKDQNRKIDRLRNDNDVEIRKIQKVLENLREQATSVREGKKAAKDQVANNDRRMAAYLSELGSIATDEAGRASLEANIKEMETRQQNAKRDLSSSDGKAKIRSIEAGIQKLESEAASLNKELMDGTQRAGDLARLDHLKKESKDRQRSIQTMKGAHGDRLRELVGNDWQPETLEATFQRVLDEKKKRVVEAERQRDGASRELEQLEFKLRTARKEADTKGEEVETSANELKELTQGDPEDYPEALVEAQQNRDVRNADVDNFKNMKKYFADAVDIAKSENPACRLCRRPFQEEKEIRRFVSTLEKHMSEGALKGMQDELKSYETELRNLNDAGTTYDTWKRLSTREIPRLREEISRLEQQREKLVRQVEQHDSTVSELEDLRRDAETLSKPVATIVKAQSEFKTYENQVREVAAKQKDTGASRTLEDIREELEANSVETKDLRGKLSRLQAEDRQKQEELGDLNLELGNANSKLLNARHELDKKATIEKQIAELRNSNQSQRGVMTNLDNRQQELDPELSEQRIKLEDVRERGQKAESDLQKDANKLNDTVRSLMRAQNDIQTYIDNGGSNRLDQCQRDIHNLEKEIETLLAEEKQVATEINKLNADLHDQEAKRRVINDNLTFRKQQRDLADVEGEIDKLSAQNAEADQAQYRAEADYWDGKNKVATAEETGKLGQMKSKDDQLAELLREWDTDYKDAAAAYKRAHIDVETTRAVIEDLARYGGALDKAIMKYHALKMEEINRLLQELWQKTYQGTDIDSICVRSENEDASTTNSSGTRRSYNYRVVMIKQDAEMDMRGRCSAGQKVLASILIRLALAECFGQNCGLIALDEPTTNLDRDNIKALARSLNTLVRERRAQRNFQLVVITHDEDFLRHMRCQDFCDHYWRVSRNDRQQSVIERQSIAEVLYN